MAFVTVPEITQDYSNTKTFVFKERDSAPSRDNKYYIMQKYGGWNPCREGNREKYPELNPDGTSVLPNCVGYAVGRFNEIGDYRSCKYLGSTNAELFWANYSIALGRSSEPSLGACVVWQSGYSSTSSDDYDPWTDSMGPGHVAIVEKINSDGSIVVSQSGWNSRNTFWRATHYKGADGNWTEGGDANWMRRSNGRTKYYFLGFIHNPAIKDVFVSTGGALTETEYTNSSSSQPRDTVAYEPVQVQTQVQGLETASNVTGRTTSTNLLTYPSTLETPFIIVTIGNYTFGSYNKKTTPQYQQAQSVVQYPNYMDSIYIKKINGTVNQYTINMIYGIEAGNDPNFLDKVFSSVSNTRLLKVSYGDWSSPTFIYKEEEAIITGITSSIDFGHSQIRYSISCTSTALSLMGNTWHFPEDYAKPSDVIRRVLYDQKYGLLEVFYGMKNETDVLNRGLILGNDRSVRIESKDMDALSYINYLVSCMCANTNNSDSPIRDSSYYLSIFDDVYGEVGGPYFKITQVKSSSKTISQAGVYDVDVGFPGETPVQNFSIKNNDSWSILYNYSNSIQQQDYVYKIDNDGNIYQEYSPNITTSSTYYTTTEPQKSWWTKMTQFPITAELTIKGLVRAATLMSYIRVNAFFYGQRHISSGLYVITQQEDTVSSSGYRTKLTLLRVGGDEDYLTTKTVTSTTYSPVTGPTDPKSLGAEDIDAIDAQLNGDHISGNTYGGYSGGGGHGGGAGRPSKNLP